jgi:hypothetical protein
MYLRETKDMNQDLRVDPALGTVVHVVGNRQSRPNLATNAVTSDCPFCVGPRTLRRPLIRQPLATYARRSL